MPSIQQLSVVATLFSSAFALPAGGPQFQAPKIHTRFSVKNVANTHFAGNNGPAAYKKATAKFGISNLQQEVETTSSASTSVTSHGKVLLAQPGDAEATSEDGTDLQYLTPILINGQEYLLDFDTGSSNLWIGGNTTSARNKYTPKSQPISGSWTVGYADGSSVMGDVYRETVSIGETIVTNVAVGRASRAPARMFNTGKNGEAGSDGLLGLGFTSLNTFVPQQSTWMDQAVAQGLPNVFAANLMPRSIEGSYDFGFINKASYSGDVTYINVDNQAGDNGKFWTVTPTKGDRGVMDTGTTLLMLSNATVTSYYNQIPGAHFNTTEGGYVYPCSAKTPDYTIEFGAHKAVIPGAYMLYSGIAGTNFCYGAIQDRGTLPFSIYGDRFFMSQYVIFDQTTGVPRIGFANKA